MKFYLTKAAQLAAEGKAPAADKARWKTSLAPSSPVSSEVLADTAPPSAAATDSPELSVRTSRKVARSSSSDRLMPEPRTARAKAPKNGLLVGGEPRVDLLPLEVRAERRGAQNVRRAWLGVVGVAALVVLGIGGATLYAADATNALSESQVQTNNYVAQQSRYSKVKIAQEQVDLIKAARSVGGSTEIDWNSYLAKVQATLPNGVVVTSINLTSSSPLTAFGQATSPLQGTRVATLSFTATSSTLPSVPTWLDGLTRLPGYADATPGSVKFLDGTYTTNVTMHINQDAYSGRFTGKGK